MQLVLASGSPRRKEILKGLGLSFEVIVSGADEQSISGEHIAPALYVQELALLKASATQRDVRALEKKRRLILAADTVVCYKGQILGKPKDEEDAFSMLSTLSGQVHEVHTGICLMNADTGFAATDFQTTQVVFDELSDETIKAYIETGEPMDKAGAYGIQGIGTILVKEIRGDYFNVVGLPVRTLNHLLETEFDTNILTL